MTKTRLLPMAVFIAAFSFISCKKNNAPTPNVEGFWQGTYGQGANNTGAFNSFLFNSKAEVTGYFSNNPQDTVNADKVFGTYAVSKNTVTLSFEQDNFIYSGTINEDNTITGSWGYDPKIPNTGGHFIIKK